MSNSLTSTLSTVAKPVYWILLALMVIPFNLFPGFEYLNITPPVALFIGLCFAFLFGVPCPKFNKKLSKYLLQLSVILLGFGMNLEESLKSGAEGMVFTIVSVIGVMIIGWLLGKYMSINSKTSYLISSGTAICGGSAIAAVGPVLKADENEMAVSLGVIFILNAIALFIFPPMGHFFDMDQTQFGTWAAIAIHDTSSVVGAGAAYDASYFQGAAQPNLACDTATLIKCTRALWIIPLAFFTMWAFRGQKGGEGKGKVTIPWFIFLFVVAMIINTYLPQLIAHITGKPTETYAAAMTPFFSALVVAAKKALVAVLFAIGASLSIKVIKQVGFKPLFMAIIIWIAIGATSLFVVLNTIG